MNLLTCVENRKKNVAKMNEAGMSVYDIARFYQVPPGAIKDYIEDVLKVPYNNDPKDEKSRLLYRSFAEKRDENYAKAVAGGSDVLDAYKEKIGLVAFSPSRSVVEGIIDEYKKIRNIDESQRVKVPDRKRISSVNENELFCELYASSWNRKDILDYADINLNLYTHLVDLAKMTGYHNHGDIFLAEEMLKDGFRARDVSFITGVHEYYVRDCAKNADVIEEKHRRAEEKRDNVTNTIRKIHDNRAEECYKLYVEEKMTQAEIAKELFGNENARVKVGQYVATYLASHPEAAIKEKITNRGHRRNVSEGQRLSVQKKEARILEFVKENPDMNMYHITETLAEEGISMNLVYRTLEREGLYTKRFFTKDEFDFNRRFLELKARFVGMSTSEIMALVSEGPVEKYINNPSANNYRFNILNDIEKEVNFIIANPDIQERIIDRACILSREEMLGPKFYKIALEEMSVKMGDTQKEYISRMTNLLDKLIDEDVKEVNKESVVEFKYGTEKVNLSRDEAISLLNNTQYRLHYVKEYQTQNFFDVKYDNKAYVDLIDSNNFTVSDVKNSVQKVNKFMHEALGFDRGLIEPTLGDKIGFIVRQQTENDVAATKLSKVDWEAKNITSIDDLVAKIQSGDFPEQKDFSKQMNKTLLDLADSYQKNEDFERE